ncbi:MAG: hypothetical protein ABR577_15610 [Pyrinomonadaceae bacterium]
MKFTNSLLSVAMIGAAVLSVSTGGVAFGFPQDRTGKGQQDKKTDKLKKAKPEAIDEQVDPDRLQAINILDREIDRAKKYNRLSDSIRVWTAAADALWKANPGKAKKTLQEAYSRIEDAFPPERKDESKAIASVRTIALRGELRSEILVVAQRHDPAMIKDLVTTVEEDKKQLIADHNEPIMFGSSSFQKEASRCSPRALPRPILSAPSNTPRKASATAFPKNSKMSSAP